MFHVLSRIWSWLTMAGMVPSQATTACGSLVATTPQPKTLHVPGAWGLSSSIGCLLWASWALASSQKLMAIWFLLGDLVPKFWPHPEVPTFLLSEFDRFDVWKSVGWRSFTARGCMMEGWGPQKSAVDVTYWETLMDDPGWTVVSKCFKDH